MTIYLIDSNILVYAHNMASQYHEKAKEITEQAINGDIKASISYQNLYEFYAIITDPKRVEKPVSLEEALDLVETYRKAPKVKKVYPRKTNLDHVLKLLREHGLTKQSVFECLLVATMIENNIRGIYTRNYSHFRRFKFLEVINPFT